MTLEEYEDKLFECAAYFVNKMAKTNDDCLDENFDEFVDVLESYGRECIKIAETRVYNYLTIRSAKDVVDKFKLIVGYLNAAIQHVKHGIKTREEINEFLKKFLRLKIIFENIVSCCDNYLLKKNGRTYGILQDESINMTCKLIMKLFDKISIILQNNKQFGSFVMDIERMSKRYNYFNKLQTFDLEDADVIGK